VVSNEDILTWLTKWGHDWVGLIDVFNGFYVEQHGNTYDPYDKFWENLQTWHDGAYLSKRHVPDAEPRKIEQYKLTKKAVNSLSTSLDKSA